MDIGQGELAQTLYVFKSKPKETDIISNKIIPDKVGFVIGHFPYVSHIYRDQSRHTGSEASQRQSLAEKLMGAAFFVQNHKLQLFETSNFYQDQVKQVVDHLERMLKIEHPCNVRFSPPSTQHHLKLVFVPNLKLKSDIR